MDAAFVRGFDKTAGVAGAALKAGKWFLRKAFNVGSKTGKVLTHRKGKISLGRTATSAGVGLTLHDAASQARKGTQSLRMAGMTPMKSQSFFQRR